MNELESFFREKYEALPQPERWIPGPPSVWSQMPVEKRKLSIRELRNRIIRENQRHFALDDITEDEIPEHAIEELGDNDIPTEPSAVLVPLIKSSNPDIIDSILLMTRTNKVSHHKGQVSFPGGMVEIFDKDIIETALRETYEETGVPSDSFAIVGTTPVTHTRSRSGTITPVIATCTDSIVSQFKPNTEEVDTLHVIDISEFVAPDHYMSEVWDYGGMSPTIHMFFVQDRAGQPVFVWGATAHIIYDVLHCLNSLAVH